MEFLLQGLIGPSDVFCFMNFHHLLLASHRERKRDTISLEPVEGYDIKRQSKELIF